VTPDHRGYAEAMGAPRMPATVPVYTPPAQPAAPISQSAFPAAAAPPTGGHDPRPTWAR